MASRQRNSVRILSSRERGSQSFGSQRLLQLLVEEKVRWMKWQSQKVELPDSPRSTFLLAFSPDRWQVTRWLSPIVRVHLDLQSLELLYCSSPYRTLMASTHVNHNIYITEVKTGKCLHSLVGHRRTPWCVTFHPTIPGLVASGCLDGEVRIWDLHVSIQGGLFVLFLLSPSQCGFFTKSSVVLLLITSSRTSSFSLFSHCVSIPYRISQNLNKKTPTFQGKEKEGAKNIYALSRWFFKCFYCKSVKVSLCFVSCDVQGHVINSLDKIIQHYAREKERTKYYLIHNQREKTSILDSKPTETSKKKIGERDSTRITSCE